MQTSLVLELNAWTHLTCARLSSESQSLFSGEPLSGVDRFDHRTASLARGHPLIDKQTPPPHPSCRNANPSHFKACMGTHTDRQSQQMTNDRLDAPTLRFIGQVQQLETDEH